MISILFAVVTAIAPARAGDLSGTVSDSTSGQPIPSAEISVSRGTSVVANTLSDPFGRYIVHNLPAGTYTVSARFIGFRALTRSVTIGATQADVPSVDFRLLPAAASLDALRITATTPVAVDTRSGNQVFKQDQYHGAPTNTTSQILQESIAGAARAPTGEVHIRGQHAEYTYYVDGVPVPSGISGSLNELFDPAVVDKLDFQTGGWDAEYGNKNTAVINVQTRIPAGGFHTELGTYAGQYAATNGSRGHSFDGQSASLSTNAGPWGFFLSGARQFSGMRREAVVFDTLTKSGINFHNNGFDYFGFGKIQYTPNTRNVVSLDMNLSQTLFDVPYDSVGGITANDRQRDDNSFVNLGWNHRFADAANAPQLFAALFYRHGSLRYTPGASDDPQFIFAPDTTLYSLSERRSFATYGAKVDYDWHPREKVELKVGTQSSLTRGHEDFATTSATGSAGPASNSALVGEDVGVFAQTAITPVEWFELRTGVRYDAHHAPFAGTQTQFSPRLRLNFYPSPATTLFAYYGRLFMPTNVEDLRAITSAALGDSVTPVPTLPERDHFFELGAIRRFDNGLTTKLSAFRKNSSPGLDDNTVPGSAIVTSVNIADVHVTGLEAVMEYDSHGMFSGYLNASLNHAYGRGPVTGGFFPAVPPSGDFDLDHDQRLSVVGTVNFAANRLYLSATEIYGSGLTNGVDPADCGCSYGTGLFDFNSGIKVAPSAITNLSAGYTFVAGGAVIRPQLYVENAFNQRYLLKGAFFSGAAVGRPRSLQLRVNVSR